MVTQGEMPQPSEGHMIVKVSDHTGSRMCRHSCELPLTATVRDLKDKIGTLRPMPEGCAAFEDAYAVQFARPHDNSWADIDPADDGILVADLGIKNQSTVLLKRSKKMGSNAQLYDAQMTSPDPLPLPPPAPSLPTGGQLVVRKPDGAASSASGSAWPSASSSSSCCAPGSSSYSDWDRKSATGYVGLSNQGATCYMNSLLQGLYMTPEFRKAVYDWSFEDRFQADYQRHKSRQHEGVPSPAPDGGKKAEAPETDEEFRERKETRSIPLQLQRLFARLQFSSKRAVETVDLTRSFGWTDAEAFTQHDVQELCRVLFDALEESMAQTHQANIINTLFQGKMTDYVRCMECQKYNARQDVYLDIPLVIKGFGETRAVSSIEEALTKFTQPEYLEGPNAYMCERCNKKVRAQKGLEFVSFPYILMLQLKRFDFDYETGRRVKLNDSVSFPHILDLNPYLEGHRSTDATMEEAAEPAAAAAPATAEDADADRMEDDGAAPVQDPVVTPDRPYVYRLYGILIHRGSAMGGHYYAYIMSFGSNKWYEFNDSTVSEITEDDIRKSYGESDNGAKSSSGYSWMGSYGANAYMLFYRRVDPERNINPPTGDEVPQIIKDWVEQEKEKERAAEEKRKAERDTFSIHFIYDEKETVIPLHRTTKFGDAKRAVMDALKLTGKYTDDCVRFRHTRPACGIMTEVIEATPETPLQSVVRSYDAVAVEVKEKDAEFESYDPNTIGVKVVAYSAASQSFSTRIVYTDPAVSVAQFKELLGKRFSMQPQRIRLLQEPTSAWEKQPYYHLNEDAKSLNADHSCWDGTRYVIEECDDGNALVPMDSAAGLEIGRLRNQLTIKLNILHPGPTAREETVQTDKRLTLREFKDTLKTITGLDPSEIVVSRGTVNWKYEIKELDESLDEHRVYDGVELWVERGKPTRAGESKVTVFLYDEANEDKPYEKLFEAPVLETAPVEDVKALICARLLEERKLQVDPALLRLRDMTSVNQLPGKIAICGYPVKEFFYLYNGKNIAVQILKEPENVTTKDNLTFFVQHWNPKTLEFASREEIVVPSTTTVNELREMLAHRISIPAEQVGVVRVYASGLEGASVIDAAVELTWDKATAENGNDKIDSSPMYVHDGDLVLFRDNKEERRELSIQERQKYEKEAAAKRSSRYSSMGRQESALKIHKDDKE
eukprot:m51a1_g56 putative ubiquitin carboxyl-terminal hydrolase 47-like isoform x2 (1178) ;mRNA; f:177637-182668